MVVIDPGLVDRPSQSQRRQERCTAVASSFGIAAIPNLGAFLPEFDVRPPVWPGIGQSNAAAVLGWGLKPASERAARAAAAAGKRFIRLEDGFLRSISLGEMGAPPMSLVVDEVGVYYDATRPSHLENLLASTGWETPALMDRAARLRDEIVRRGLSKTNMGASLPPEALPRSHRARILLVDQTLGDLSVTRGLAGDDSFKRMLDAARREHPRAELIVRRHPAVTAGLKAGWLSPDLGSDVRVLEADFPLSQLLDRVDAVYTVTSQVGFEAIMRGVPVRCFGAPFYAGWFASDDDVIVARRGRRRSPLEIFAATMLLYARYVDPLSGEPCEAEQVVERLSEFKRRAERLAGYSACLGFHPWKHGNIRELLKAPRAKVDFFLRPSAAIAAAKEKGGRVICWASNEPVALPQRCSEAGVALWRMEDGFLRSKGLGSDFHPARSVSLDDLGVHFDPNRPSRLESLLEHGDAGPEAVAEAAALREFLVRRRLTKYNIAGAASPQIPSGRHAILVVGQVEDDDSIRRGAGDIRTNLALLRAVRADHPTGFLIYKPHPDIEAGNRRGKVPTSEARQYADVVCRNTDILSLLDRVDAVATMTSLCGFEALLRGKSVYTYGGPFYAGWGLTRDRMRFPRRTRRLSLDELVHGALIAYPLYCDLETGLPCSAAHTASRLDQQRDYRHEPRRFRHLSSILMSFSRQDARPY